MTDRKVRINTKRPRERKKVYSIFFSNLVRSIFTWGAGCGGEKSKLSKVFWVVFVRVSSFFVSGVIFSPWTDVRACGTSCVVCGVLRFACRLPCRHALASQCGVRNVDSWHIRLRGDVVYYCTSPLTVLVRLLQRVRWPQPVVGVLLDCKTETTLLSRTMTPIRGSVLILVCAKESNSTTCWTTVHQQNSYLIIY